MSDLNQKHLMKIAVNKQSQQEKKKESKKAHIKSTIINILSHQPRKLMKLAKKSAYQIKNIDNQLIPKLSLKNLYPQISQMQKINEQKKKQFESMNNELTTSMLFFHNNITKLSNQQQGKILQIQASKCYKHIPSYFFQELTLKQISKLLTKNKKEVQQVIYDLIDYSDEVQYNINQQVNYKMKIFMEFVAYLKGIGHLVQISAQKMRGARNQNKIVRQIIVQKSININLLRIKQENLKKSIEFLQQIKKVKHIQKSLMSMINAKGKMSVCQLYQTYISEHLKIKEICCKHHLCNFSDIKYFVQRNYHEIFNKALQNYLGQIIKIQKDKIKQIFHPKKSKFTSTPHSNNSSRQNFQFKNIGTLDESIEEDEIELIVKSNIQKQILHIFQMGLEKCTYSTDFLCQFLKEEVQKIQLQFFQTLYQNINKKEDLLQNFINFTLNKPTSTSLQISLQNKNLSINSRVQICNKIPLIKFIGCIQIYSKNLQNMCARTNSIINQLLKALKPLQKHQPQKYQIILAYLIQIVMIVISFSQNSLGSLIEVKEIKQNQIQIADKLICLCKEWQVYISQMQSKYFELWRKLSYNISLTSQQHKSFPNLQNKDSFNSLKDFVAQNLDKSDYQDEDVSMDLMENSEIVMNLIQKLIKAKNKIININFTNFTKQVINKEIIKYLELQTWIPINISGLTQSFINYILYCREQTQCKKEEIDEHKFLSNSLLLDKSNIAIAKKSQQLIKPSQNKFSFSTTDQKVIFGQSSFKLIKSVQFLIEIVYKIYLYFDQYTIFTDADLSKTGLQTIINKDSSKTIYQSCSLNYQLLLSKLTQVFLVFSNQIKNILSNLNSLKNKVKSFAKFFVLIFSQVQLVKTFAAIIFSNFERISKVQKVSVKQLDNGRHQMQTSLQNLINEIGKKYNESTILKVKQVIKKMQINSKKPVICPSQSTKEIISIFSKSFSLLQEHFVSSNKFQLFLGGSSWIKLYIEKLNDQQKILQKSNMKSTGSNSNRLAEKIQQIDWQQKNNWIIKELQYMVMQIQAQSDFKYLKDMNLIISELASIKNKKTKNIYNN